MNGDWLRHLFKNIRPWKRNFVYKDSTQDYNDGWNDCIKEMKKSEKRVLELLESNKDD